MLACLMFAQKFNGFSTENFTECEYFDHDFRLLFLTKSNFEQPQMRTKIICTKKIKRQDNRICIYIRSLITSQHPIPHSMHHLCEMWDYYSFLSFFCHSSFKFWMLQILMYKYLNNLFHINICNMPIALNVNFTDWQRYTHCLILFWHFVICRPSHQKKNIATDIFKISVQFNPSFSFHSRVALVSISISHTNGDEMIRSLSFDSFAFRFDPIYFIRTESQNANKYTYWSLLLICSAILINFWQFAFVKCNK